jgi:hypothetical protein
MTGELCSGWDTPPYGFPAYQKQVKKEPASPWIEIYGSKAKFNFFGEHDFQWLGTNYCCRKVKYTFQEYYTRKCDCDDPVSPEAEFVQEYSPFNPFCNCRRMEFKPFPEVDVRIWIECKEVWRNVQCSELE